ncbi:hypothetical protein OUY22_22040 [Nonomuraea sp. MCN248]|uniref:CHAT domain-containing protein n=1 Tax=Nonomuraea corallina TaxID=2989783 RepID=A0ABT4SFW6_9ACTN|nr:hypothetical protein [Nonomuraea corallina]MDA0636111.1 hypothetical protein [Nonomuraea corallina]
MQRGVQYVGPGTPWAERVIRLLSPAEDLLDPPEALQVATLLRGCEVEDLRILYQVATEGKGRGFPGAFQDAGHVFEFLLDAPTGERRLLPHLRFAAYVLGQLLQRRTADQDTVSELSRWLYRQRDQLRAENKDPEATELERLLRQRLAFETRTDLPTCLIVEIDPLAVPDGDDDPHLVTHWTHSSPLGWNPERGGEVELPLARVADHVVELVLAAERDWSPQRGGPLLLEFRLAPELVNLSVDQWPRRISEELPPRALGADYEVVLRSDRRLRPDNTYRRWYDRWHVFLDGRGAAHLAPLDDGDAGNVHASLMGGADVVACVLSAPPDSPQGRAQLDAAMDAGVPIVLWCRDSATNGEFRKAVTEVLQPQKLKKLPESIHQLRSSTPTCGNVALLWDDPGRPIPEVQPLRSPS